MSATLNDYLVLLESLRDDLASNLRKRGVEALDTETLQILVPKVLQIPQGILIWVILKERLLRPISQTEMLNMAYSCMEKPFRLLTYSALPVILKWLLR